QALTGGLAENHFPGHLRVGVQFYSLLGEISLHMTGPEIGTNVLINLEEWAFGRRGRAGVPRKISCTRQLCWSHNYES
ncbi:MAG: hypothetical protein ACR2O5_04440, partial [Thiogranum sp.]